MKLDVVDDDVASLSLVPGNEIGANNAKKPSALRTAQVTALVLLAAAIITLTALAVMSPRTLPIPFDSVLDEQPPGIPEEYVAEVLARVFHQKGAAAASSAPPPPPSNSSTHHLQKRVVPSDQKCDEGHTWTRRDCDTDRGPSAWTDSCVVDSATGEGFYQRIGSCQLDENCFEHQDGDDKHTISCLPKTQNRRDNIRRDKEKKKTNQYGYRQVPVVMEIGGKQVVLGIGVQTDIGDASASGFLADSTKSYVVAPTNPLLAVTDKTEDLLCISGFGQGRDCSPKMKRNFSQGDVVDYTFGITFQQEVILFYSLWGDTKITP